MEKGHGFYWIDHVPVVGHLPHHVSAAILIIGVVAVCTWIAQAQLKKYVQANQGGLIPESTMTFRNFFEIVADSLYKLTESVMGHHDAKTFFPVIGSLFVFIFTANLAGLIPGFPATTENFNTTLALGVFVFLYYNFVGFKANGVAYLKHFLGPVLWLSPLLLVIEIASHLFRPLSLALRLRGNIMGDHVVLGIFSELVPLLIPIIFYGLGVFVAFVQAFVFCLMTMVYISLSTSHDH